MSIRFDKQELNQLYRYCYALTVHRDDAYDLLQAALEKYLKYLDHSVPHTNNSEMAYLRRIIHNQFIDQVRRSKCVEFKSLEDSYSDGNISGGDVIAIDSTTLDTMLINEELVEWIWSILSSSERELLFLWAVEGYTALEIASELGTVRGTILSRIHRLRKKINSKLAEETLETNRMGDGLS